MGVMRACAVVPAYEAAATLGAVVAGLLCEVPHVIVVDDGSRDGTADAARAAGAEVVVLDRNRGKGFALRTALLRARALGFDVALSFDADGQHPPAEAARLLAASSDVDALVLGVRDLARAGAPRANVFGNDVSNFFLSRFARRALADTQCGMRRYPVVRTLALAPRDAGFAFEGEVLLRAARAGVAIVEVPVTVVYDEASRRSTHFRKVLDPARIVRRVVLTLLEGWPARAARLAAAATLAVVALALGAHELVAWATAMRPPAVVVALPEVVRSPGDPSLRVAGASWARRRGSILEVHLEGTPEAIGAAHARLLHDERVENEAQLLAELERRVPSRLGRALLFDAARVRFRALDAALPDARRRETAAEALAFAPDPFAGVLPTYQRLTLLQSFYDVVLSFERSPLVGCTSFALSGAATADGHTLVGRAFDFEAGEAFDRGKAVFVVREAGALPYASVAWPGFVGVVTGVNAAGVALAVHGARAGTPSREGEPVATTLREVLGHATSTREALAMLGARAAMVAHLVLVADASGDAAVVERAPGAAPYVRRGAPHLALTNHFEGPLAADPADRRVRAETTTLERRARLDERLASLGAADPLAVLDVLRDRRAAGGAALAPGDRRALDADVAAHGVVIDATARVLWVSEAPHLSGRFVRFDLGALAGAAPSPLDAAGLDALPARAALASPPR